jgi:arylsulfatase A-like enzyme
MPQSPVLHRWIRVLSAAALALTLTVGGLPEAQAQEKKPNILVIMGDDIGIWNISVWNRGMMGFQTPNIDRITNEGALFSTYYGQQSCTAGRAAFITGQAPFRTGLTNVGLPGSPIGSGDGAKIRWSSLSSRAS